MFEVDTNNIVAVTRGDTFKAPLFINKGTDLKPIRYVLNDKDELYLGVMQTNQYFEDAILKKKFTNKNLDENWISDLTIRDAIERLNDREKLILNKRFFET